MTFRRAAQTAAFVASFGVAVGAMTLVLKWAAETTEGRTVVCSVVGLGVLAVVALIGWEQT